MKEYFDQNGDAILVNSLVAFVDILGYRDRIDAVLRNGGDGKSDLTILIGAVSEAMESVKLMPSLLGGYKFYSKTFTDNFVFVTPLVSRTDDAVNLVLFSIFISRFQWKLAQLGLFVRGGISIGPVHISQDMVFGPALTDAYDTESKKAVHPRVVISDSTRRNLPRLPPNSRNLLWTGIDGRPFVNYLAGNEGDPPQLDSPEFLRKHRQMIDQKLKEVAQRVEVYDKFLWVDRFHEAYCADRAKRMNKTYQPIGSTRSEFQPWVDTGR